MKWVVLLAVLAGCNSLFGFDDGKLHLGGGDDSGLPIDGATQPIDATIDGTPIDAAAIDASLIDAPPGVCNPVAQTGCGSGEKCTWIWIDRPNSVGQTGCVPDGNVAAFGTCTQGPDGPTTGYDDCVHGNLCVGTAPNLKCEPICTTSPDSCATQLRCTAYAGVFDQSTIGLCDWGCDPVTQVRFGDNAAACGSPNPAMPDHGCYKFDERTAICASTPIAARTQKQDDVVYNYPQAAYINGCAPGYGYVMTRSGTDLTPICTAFCRPTTTSSSSTAGEGGVPGSGYTCGDRGAAGHECHYYWSFETNPTAADDGIGVCWTPANFVGDWDNNAATPDTGYPACNTLPATDTDGDSVPQNKQFGCAPF